MRNIGKVILKVDKLLEKNNYSVSKFAREARLQFNQAKRYQSGEMQKVDLVVLARICDSFDCKITDILEYVPSSDD